LTGLEDVFNIALITKFKGSDILMVNPIEVEVNGDLERAFKNLKKKMAFEGVFKELKRRRYYEKPSAQKKRKQEEAERRRVKKMRRMVIHPQPKKMGMGMNRPYSTRPQSADGKAAPGAPRVQMDQSKAE
jgi:small subunit ribosomal protein S21